MDDNHHHACAMRDFYEKHPWLSHGHECWNEKDGILPYEMTDEDWVNFCEGMAQLGEAMNKSRKKS